MFYRLFSISGSPVEKIVIASFYKFVHLIDFSAYKTDMLAKMHELGIKGTIILAQEGINGSFAGTREPMNAFYEFMNSNPAIGSLKFKETYDVKNPFEKAKVKLRKEIVTMGMNVEEMGSMNHEDTYLSPEEWHQLIQDPEVLLLDTRNDYEYELGTFKNAILPDIENFREFPQYVAEHLSDKKDKKIAMFCTGGIRCEKTTAYMKQQGFQQVYQLHDGILNYIETMPKEDSLWEGECFVFDNRVAVNKELERVYPQLPEDYKDRKNNKNKSQ